MNNEEWKELCLARELFKDIKEQIKLIIESNTFKERTTMGYDFIEQRIDKINNQLTKYYGRINL